MKRLKKFSALFLSVIIAASALLIVAGTKTTVLIGDVDGNNKVSASDARLVLLASAGLYTDIDKDIADIDNDTKITAVDARYILRASAQLESLVCIRYGHDVKNGNCINCDYTAPATEPESVTSPAETTTNVSETSTTFAETTTIPEETTTIPEETTTIPEETTTIPEETTTIPEETTTIPEETTTISEETTTISEETTTDPETTTKDPETTTKPVSTEELAYETFLLINEYRATLGLYPLTFNAELSEITLVRAKEASVYWSHTRPDGRSFWTVFIDYNKFTDKQSGEILAKITIPDAKRAVKGWINSPSHNEILTTTKYNQIGIACYLADDGYCYFAAHTIKTDYNESTTVPEESTTTGTTTPPVSTEDLAYETFLIINEYRASLGIYPLTFNAELSEITLARAKETSVCWGSTRPDGRDFHTIFDDYNKFNNDAVSEIMAKFKDPDASQVVSSLYNSPFSNIMLTSTYNQIGIAYYLAENGYYYFVIHTMQ